MTKEAGEYALAVCTLASGSKGNATYISDGTTSILIDAGLSGIELERRMSGRGINPSELSGIIVSHEHIDHVRGVGILSRRYDLPVYINSQTHKAALPIVKTLKINKTFACGRSFAINQLVFHPFALSHDATDPAGFTVTAKNVKIGLATDLGVATGMVKQHLKNCELLILEANHDSAMLEQGPYPWPLKQRIKSRTGHLSNEDSRILVNELKHPDLKHVILGHLSEINNTPEKALSHVGAALDGCRASLNVAVQDTCGEMIFLR
jgi:phosphoribosyl 1,2-cyclic phosphodiesterase